MRLAVFSDIHANLEALQSFIDHAHQQNIDRYMCLGDIVGYGADPSPCIALVRTLRNIAFVQGNHDAAISWDSSPYSMSSNARASIMWTMEQITTSDKEFLRRLPLTFNLNNLFFSHANPYNPKAWRYVNNRKYAMRSFRGCSEKMLFVGHTHSPLVITRKNLFQLDLHSPEIPVTLKVHPGKRQIFNCGSIGQPRTGNTGLNYLVYDTEKETITYFNVAYDHKQAGKKILAAGLPPILAKRLQKGI
jgi:predicted phosphodiesterase